MTNKYNNVLYTGVTSNLILRVSQHRYEEFKGFSCRYNLKKLVYYEHHFEAHSAIAREKQIKKGNRKRKIALINAFNPEWKDLWDSIK